MKSDTSEELDLLRLLFTQKHQYLFGLITFQLAVSPDVEIWLKPLQRLLFSGSICWQLQLTFN